MNPLQIEVFHISRRDLVERAIPLAEIGARVHQPVLWLLSRLQQPIETHIRDPGLRHRLSAASTATPLRLALRSLSDRGDGQKNRQGNSKPKHDGRVTMATTFLETI